jgi:hypothetical protein
MYAKRTPQLSTNNYQLSTVSELLTDKLQVETRIGLKNPAVGFTAGYGITGEIV